MGESDVRRLDDKRNDGKECAVSKGPARTGSPAPHNLNAFDQSQRVRERYNMMHSRSAVQVKTTDLIKLKCGELCHPLCDLLKYPLTLDIRDPGRVVPKF